MGRLFLLFTVVPLIELYLLIAIGRVLGIVPTLALVLLTGAVGAFFARAEGMRVLNDWRSSFANGQAPRDGVIDGVLLLAGGLMLITPGILTDAFGLSLVIPGSRRFIAGRVRQWVQTEVARGRIQVVTGATGGPAMHSPQTDPREVQAEVINVKTADAEVDTE